MPQQDHQQRNGQRPNQILVVGVLHVRPGSGRNVCPGGVGWQPNGRRPESCRYFLEYIHIDGWARRELVVRGVGVYCDYASMCTGRLCFVCLRVYINGTSIRFVQ